MTQEQLEQSVQQYHNALPERIKTYLTARGINEEIIKLYLLGWDGSYITIPIFEDTSAVKFIKKRKDPNNINDSVPKYLNEAGSSASLYGIENVLNRRSPLVICEGEFDRLVLESKGIAAITSTGGAGTFKIEWAELFRDIPDLFVCFDHDIAGNKGMRRVAELIPNVKIITLPDEVGEGGDITDFFTKLGKTSDDFKRLMETGFVIEQTRPLLTEKTQSAQPRENKISHAIIKNFADIKPESISWLWPDRIALGKLTLIAGDPSLGKSLVTANLMAIVSKGYKWPADNSCSPIGDIVVLSAEDDPGDTIRPRLDAAGADCSRISILEAVQANAENGSSARRMFSLKRDILALDDLLATNPNYKLVVIDPISAYLDGTDSHNNADVRGLLAPLAELAIRYKVAILLIQHLNKSGGGKALYRPMGSLAFIAAPRAAFIVAKDPENPQRRLFLPAKNNIAKEKSGLAYSILTAENGAPVIAWESEPVTTTADEALALATPNGELSATDEAVDFLRSLLLAGPMRVTDLMKEARQAGISEKPLRSAREKLGIKPSKSDFKGGWLWALPEDAQLTEEALNNIKGTLGIEGILE